MRQIDRQLRKLLRQAEVAVAERQREAAGGVYVCESREEFEAARDWPMAEVGQTGKLLAMRQLTVDEWIDRHSPQPPVHEGTIREEPERHDPNQHMLD